MTFAVIRRGVLTARVQAETFDALVAWYGPRRQPGDVLAILADEGLRVGERVEVAEVLVGLARRPRKETRRWQ